MSDSNIPDSNIPVKYVLYSHYSYNEEDDFKNYYDKNISLGELEGVRYLLEHLCGLKELLTPCEGLQGMLVLFYSPGYKRFLEGLARGRSNKDILSISDEHPKREKERKQLHLAKRVASYVEKQLQRKGLEKRVRFLTSLDLDVILGRVNDSFAGQFQRFFLGEAEGLRYDSPKVIESILRLRILGHGVPVLRLDHDVIFQQNNKDDKDIRNLNLSETVARAVEAYHLRLDEPTVSSFLFSASYDSEKLRDSATGGFEAWSRAFATRIFPALVVNEDEINKICISSDDEKNKKASWDDYVANHFNEELARKFYGLQPGPGLEPNGTQGLTSIGAHPLHAVVSGALLCMSESAILDLPPFSNLSNNVMWIDDHLKYSLHRAMNHFTSGETLTLNQEPNLSNARLDHVSVIKARPPASKLHNYIFGDYLPTLLWGAIMDAWITSNPILKCRFDPLNTNEQDKWRAAKDRQDQAPLPRAMLEALRVGRFDNKSKLELREELEKSAVERIEEVRQLWAGLKIGTEETFASYWASGRVDGFLNADFFEKRVGSLWKGIIGPDLSPEKRINVLDDIPDLGQKVDNLINDTLNYVDWTLEWPKFVQIVRSIRQGEFKGDLTWRP